MAVIPATVQFFNMLSAKSHTKVGFDIYTLLEKGFNIMESNEKISRREMVGGLGAGMLAMAVPSGFAMANQSGYTVSNLVLEDPREKYPKPPFKSQRQPWPGLAGQMEPKPDHGERSYKGSGRLTGRKALITGGDSGMGRAAAIAYAREGADVAINYLPNEETDAKEAIALIKAEGRKAVAIPGDLRSEDFCKRLVADAVSALGGLDFGK